MTVNEKGEVTIVFNNDLTELKERWEELKREEDSRRRNLQSTFDNIQTIDDLKSLFIIQVERDGKNKHIRELGGKIEIIAIEQFTVLLKILWDWSEPENIPKDQDALLNLQFNAEQFRDLGLPYLDYIGMKPE